MKSFAIIFLLFTLVLSHDFTADEIQKHIQDTLQEIEDIRNYEGDLEETRKQELRSATLPFNEEEIKRLLDIPQDATLPVEPKRLTNVTKEEFISLASRGIPVIVEDGTKDWKAKDHWNCEYFKKEFPNEIVEGWTDYDEKQRKEKMRLPFKDMNVNIRHNISDDIPENEQEAKHLDKKNPTVMSWLWYPISPDNEKTHHTEVAKKLSQYYQEPYYIEKTRINDLTIKNRFEAFFGTKDSGVHPHVDEICQFILSTQMAGQKSWRLSVPVNDIEFQKANPHIDPSNHDNELLIARMMAEHPIYEFTLSPGEQIVFPPGMIHGTKVKSEECSFSLSLQFSDPSPVNYITNFLPYFMSEFRIGLCYPAHFNYWIFGTPRLPSSEGGEKDNQAECDGLFQTFDRNKDDQLDHEEIKTSLLDDQSFRENLKEDPFRDEENDIQSFIRLHDKNGDSLVSKEEYVDICKAAWVKRMWEFAHKEELRNDILGDLEKLFSSLSKGSEVIDEKTHQKNFPDCVLFPVVVSLLDSDDDRKIEKEELTKAIEVLLDSEMGRGQLIPLSILLTGTMDGLDYLREEQDIKEQARQQQQQENERQQDKQNDKKDEL